MSGKGIGGLDDEAVIGLDSLDLNHDGETKLFVGQVSDLLAPLSILLCTIHIHIYIIGVFILMYIVILSITAGTKKHG